VAVPPPQTVVVGQATNADKIQPDKGKLKWTQETATELQDAVDRIFGKSGDSLLGLDFSFTISDPFLPGCPLIGCSKGFSKLCGYPLREIVGHNCRFLVDPVPAKHIDKKMRQHTSDFCKAVALKQTYTRPAGDHEAWMPEGRPSDELVAMQVNARKDGTLFNNLFYLKVFDIGADIGEEVPYIVALQSELTGGKNDLSELVKNLEKLDESMARVRAELSTSFFVRCSVSRQFHGAQNGNNASTANAAVQSAAGSPPLAALHTNYPPEEVQPWSEGKFKMVKKLVDATRNKGFVQLMQDSETSELVAVKQMPVSWTGTSHADFLKLHPNETELPWEDIGCIRLLNKNNFRYACKLHGVFRSSENTYVVSSLASDGDLFALAEKGDPPGPKREAKMASIVVQICMAMQLLHNMMIVHRDISLENVLQTTGEDGNPEIRIIDFGMATVGRKFPKKCARGKASYQAPEMRMSQEYDAFLSDQFAVGVVVYSVLLKDYPWLSTEHGKCKCFEYVLNHGLRAFCEKRCVRSTQDRVINRMSKPLMQLLEGMLIFNPEKRLTLGEKQWVDRRSVWDETWMKKAKDQLGVASM
jgi:hypothetical protein